MDPSQTTPPEGSERDFGWGERRRPPESEEPPARSEEPRAPAEESRYAAEDYLGGDTVGPDWRGFREGMPPPPRGQRLDFSALFVLLDVVRRAAPAEIQDRLTTLIREALLTLRALIDWYLDRLERPEREPQVEDIPIE